jgi:ParB-like chromosome segregation protein Spo0J
MSQEIRNPNSLVIVTKALLKAHPDWAEPLSKFYDLRAERGLDPVFSSQVKAAGRIIQPVGIARVDGIGDVVVYGRQRTRAAVANGFTSIPVTIEADDTRLATISELSENLARSDNSILENAVAFKKALQQGMSQAEVGSLAGVSDVTILNTIHLGEMPAFVHKMIDKGELSPTAALGLKTFGKKAAKGSGLSRVYDEEAQKAMKEFITSLDADAKLKGGGKKISVKQARSSSPNHVDNLTNKEWDALVAEASTPEWAANLINAVRGKVSWQKARYNANGHLDFLHKPEIPKKEKKVKEPKVKQPKAEKETSKENEVVTSVDTSSVGALDFLQ